MADGDRLLSLGVFEVWDALRRELRETDVKMQGEVRRELRALAPELRALYRAHAPVDTGATRRSVNTMLNLRGRINSIRVLGGASRAGFNYLDITRRGHATAFIYPKAGRKLKIHYLGHRHPMIYVEAGRARGYRPASDWVDLAHADGYKVIQAMEARLGRSFLNFYQPERRVTVR